MYDTNKKRWVASDREETLLPANELASDFALADAALEKAAAGTENVEAVYLMETAAKAGYAPACLAMADMFKYGWAVGKSKKQWYRWIEQAAKAGDEDARSIVERHKKAKRVRLAGALCTAVAALAMIAGVIWYTSAMPKAGRTRISLPSGVTLDEAESLDRKLELAQALRASYDTDEMKSGKIKTNRILLIYSGKKLDLHKYKLEHVMTDGEMITVQLGDAEEAKRCFEDLKALPGTQFICLDAYYGTGADAVNTLPVTTKTLGKPLYHSSVSGYDYYSWGVKAMKMDEYAAYLSKAVPNRQAMVAVIDSGVEPNAETKDRILDGLDVVYGGNGQKVESGHGTHVAGIILDATRGLDVKILPIQIGEIVFDPETQSYAWGCSASAICDAVDYAISRGVQVINMSLQGEVDPTTDPCRYYYNKAVAAGITGVVCAGNWQTDTSGIMPAYFEDFITVAAADVTGAKAYFSNHGKEVDVIAPGVDIVSYYPKTDTTYIRNSMESPSYLAVLSGTSMASPHVAALAAMIWLEYGSTPANTQRYIRAYCDGSGNDKLYYGEGMPQADRFVEGNR